MQRAICVIGHKNPDTDSICSAIAYAHLKNMISDREYEPRRAGEINQETAFVLNRYHMNYKVFDEECDLDIVPNEGRNAVVSYAASNSLGFGGHNACIVFKKFAE